MRVLHRSCLLSALTLMVGLVAGTGCPPTTNPVANNNPGAHGGGLGGGGGGGGCNQIACSDSLPCPIGLHCFQQACLDQTCHIACQATDGTISVDTSDAGGLATPCNSTCSGPNCNCVIPDPPGGPLSYSPGTPNPADVCEICNPSVSTTTWSNAANGTACELNPPNPCLLNQQCQNGVCVGSGNAGNGTPCVNPDPLCGGSSCANGSCVSSCLVMSPNAIDFGVTAQAPAPAVAWCPSIPKQISLTNACSSPVTVSSITSSGPQFVMSGEPGGSFTIPAGLTPVKFDVTFEPVGVPPAGAGPTTGTIAALMSGCPDIYTTDLTANAETGAANNTDSFNVTLVQTPVDVLWVVDIDDCTGPGVNGVGNMGSNYGLIAGSVMPGFFAQAAVDNINFNMALTTDDQGQAGWFEPCPAGRCQINSNPLDGTFTKVFNAANPNAANELANLFPHSGTWIFVPSDEQMWDGFYNALCDPAINGPTCTANLLAGPNSGFRRPGAFLAIINFEDDNEDDRSTKLGAANPTAYWDFLVGITGDSRLVSYSYLADGSTSASTNCTALVKLSQPAGGGNCGGGCVAGTAGTGCGGVLEDMVANPAWPNDVIALWADITAEGEKIFGLTEEPGGQITVKENGIEICQCGPTPCGPQSPTTIPPCGAAALWTYDSVTNSIVFATAQPPGDVVKVSYPAACP